MNNVKCVYIFIINVKIYVIIEVKGRDKMAVLNTVSYDQFADIPSLGGKSKIIFSENVYKYLNNLINETKSKNAEKGCYLVGRKSASKDEDGALCFYFDFCSSKFQTTSGNYEDSGVTPTDNNKLELIDELEKYNSLGISPCVMHFHTHNLNGLYSSLSDQDYGVYATMRNQFNIEIFGMLAAPNEPLKNETFELSVVNCRDPKVVGTRGCASFYSIPNIYYCKGSQIFKVGSFQKSRLSTKTKITELSRSDRFVQNYREWPGTSQVSGIGRNPTNNLPLVDEVVGYIDINNNLVFANENLSLEIPTIQKSKTIGFHR